MRILLVALMVGSIACSEAAPPRSGGWRLADSPSPYLQMHADNPVEWYPWGEEAFARARRENKPIFLSIGYSTCYWCHVMERQSFEDPEVARVLNANFVSIKVDREQRPDVDDLYMTAVQLMQQRGGWPVVAFLTPDLKPFLGDTYFPKAQFLQLLSAVNDAWSGNRAAVQAQARRVAEALADVHTPRGSAQVPAASVVAAAVDDLRGSYDAADGGFGSGTKFPMPANLELLLGRYEATRERALLDMVTNTLTRMARGGIHDQLGLGFHRYSTDARWQVPHFEKMLYDNAQLLRIYARAFRLTGDVVYARAAESIVALLDGPFLSSDGLWYSAMDAETNGEEGHYYVWSRDELRSALSDAESTLAKRVWGLDRHPNFKGDRYVLAWADDYRATAQALKVPLGELLERMEAIEVKLRQRRVLRPPPLVDEKIVVGWNGLAIDALAYAGAAMDRPQWTQHAQAAARTLLSRAHGDTGLAHMLRDDRAHGQAVLEDYAALLLGLTAVADAASDQGAHRQAVALADEMIARLWDTAHGGFYDAQAAATELIVRPRSQFDGAIPAGNSLAGLALQRLVTSGEARFQPKLAGLYAAFGDTLSRQPGAMTAMAGALDAWHRSGSATNVPGRALAATHSASKVRVAVGGSGGNRVVALTVDDGWHVNANPASLDFLIPTQFRATQAGRDLPLAVQYPAGQRLDAGLPDGPLRVYSGTTSIPVQARKGTLDGADLFVRVQACDDHATCLSPSEVPVVVE